MEAKKIPDKVHNLLEMIAYEGLIQFKFRIEEWLWTTIF